MQIDTMKKFKIFICIILSCFIIGCFLSCATDKSNIDDIFSQLIISDESELPAFAEHIYVIIPNGCSGELSVKAEELVEGIRAKTGILTSLKYDNELTSIPQKSCEILIGSTNRLASENAIDDLRNDEYVCRWDNGAIVVCGRSDGSTVSAIERFISDVLPFASKQSLMLSNVVLEYTVDYAIERITLNGYDLYDYVLVYPNENWCREKEIALMLRDMIKARSGYYLEVISAAEVDKRTGRIISLYGMGDKSSIAPYQNGISLEGTDAYSMSLVALRFVNDLEKAIDGETVDLKYDLTVDIANVDTTFESAFYFLRNNADVPFEPTYNLIALLKSEGFGVCFIGNPDDDLRRDLELNVKNYANMQEISVGEREIIIAYNPQRVKALSARIDADNSYITAEVETVFGEKICYIYIIKGEIPKKIGNAIVFAENYSDTEQEELYVAAKGSAALENNDLEYILAVSDNLSVENSDAVVINDKNQFSCVLKTKMLYSEELLNNTAK